MATTNQVLGGNSSSVVIPPSNGSAKPLSEIELLKAKIAEMEAKMAGMSQRQAQVITFKSSLKQDDKGVWQKAGMILYGIQRFPITLKSEQWRKLIALATDGTIEAAVVKHENGTLEAKQVAKLAE